MGGNLFRPVSHRNEREANFGLTSPLDCWRKLEHLSRKPNMRRACTQKVPRLRSEHRMFFLSVPICGLKGRRTEWIPLCFRGLLQRSFVGCIRLSAPLRQELWSLSRSGTCWHLASFDLLKQFLCFWKYIYIIYIFSLLIRLHCNFNNVLINYITYE